MPLTDIFFLFDFVLSYCECYIRTELKKNYIRVKINSPLNIGNKLMLSHSCVYNYNGDITCYFINKKETEYSLGYVSKTVKPDSIYYSWISKQPYKRENEVIYIRSIK
jgi:hypothetical protein